MAIGDFRMRVQEALNSSNEQHALVGKDWYGNAQEIMFITLARVHQKGAVFLGISAETLRCCFVSNDLQGGRLHMTTRDGNQVVLDGISGAQVARIDGNSVSIATAAGRNITCFLGNGTITVPSVVNIESRKFYCSAVEVVGVELVYALAFPNDGSEGSGAFRSCRRLTLILLMVMIVVIFISTLGFLMLIAKAAIRETQLTQPPS